MSLQVKRALWVERVVAAAEELVAASGNLSGQPFHSALRCLERLIRNENPGKEAEG